MIYSIELITIQNAQVGWIKSLATSLEKANEIIGNFPKHPDALFLIFEYNSLQKLTIDPDSLEEMFDGSYWLFHKINHDKDIEVQYIGDLDEDIVEDIEPEM